MILNLTQHAATPDQIAAGVVDLPPAARATLSEWLTFDTCPYFSQVFDRAFLIAQAAAGGSIAFSGAIMPNQFKTAMIGGAPFLMGPLTGALMDVGIDVCFAFSARVSVESVGPDGAVTKTAVFKHVGFVGPV